MLDLWIADIDRPIDPSLLDDVEAAEVARYRFEDDRKRAAMSRYMRRVVLAKYTNSDPRDLRFVRGDEGKPFLAGSGIEFNISHSGQRVVLTCAHAIVGVDIEAPRTVSDARQIASRFFASEEQAVVAEADDIQAAFFAIWTAKEAVVKAIGRGLAQALDSFVVHPVRDRFVPVESREQTRELLDGLHVRAFELDGGYRGAIAVRGTQPLSTHWLC